MKYKLLVFFTAGYAFISLAGFSTPNAIPVVPNMVLSDIDDISYFEATFLPKTRNVYIDGHGISHDLKFPDSEGACGLRDPACFISNRYFAINMEMSPIYFTNIGEPGMSAYVDVNRNFDYRDDGAVYKANLIGEITIPFSSPYKSSITITCRYKLGKSAFSKRALEHDRLYKLRVNQTREELDSKFWFIERADMIKGTNITNEKDTICVALIDKDLDGYYTPAFDWIALLPAGTKSLKTSPGYGCHPMQDGIILGYNGKAYEVIAHDASTAESIKLKYRPDLPAPIEILMNKPLPHFDVKVIGGSKVDVYSLITPGKATYINFWTADFFYHETWFANDRQLYIANSDSVKIISFAMFSEMSKARAKIEANELDWPQCVSTYDIEALFYETNFWPYGILLDQNANVAAISIRTEEVMAQLRQKN
ncbi:MAG: hypothetical protein ABIQ40_05245 [Bacteroidia bacterium]